jgi:GNAT superfamily N-acetyltransferase
MQIRKAVLEDAAQACEVIRRSIVELCQDDHGNDPAILNKWLANKTPDNVRAWIAAPEGHMLVAVAGGEILGVAAVRSSGEVTLNYVSPASRFRGVSKALLQRLEATAVALGCDRCVLTSTVTARRFYLAAGYRELGPPTSGFFTSASRQMEKPLAASASANGTSA